MIDESETLFISLRKTNLPVFIVYTSIALIDHAKKLFPVCRSLTGKGVRETLKYFEDFHSEYERLVFCTGRKVFDWEIPREWNIRDAYIQHIETGKKYAQFSASNLHVMGYSIPVDGIFELEELKAHIYTQKDQPEWIPYVTSFYKENWGFCLSQVEKDMLPKGKYRAVIDSSLEAGELHISHASLSGKCSEEIFFSSYVCHPSMANNELSGPVVLNAILAYVKEKYPDHRFTYRFALLPETIGSISYLSLYGDAMKKNVICGFNLSCVGDERAYSYVQSPYANTMADKALTAALFHKKDVCVYSFLERGSDERQYCSPGIELPLCTFCRSKFGKYPEYHTSADDFSVVTEKGLKGAFDIMKNIIDAFETCLYPLVATPCEPQLGKRGLYPNVSQKSDERHPAQTSIDIISYCNGLNSIFDISTLTDMKLSEVVSELKILQEFGLVQEKTDD